MKLQPKKRRALLVGAGRWGRVWGRLLRDDERVDIAGVIDIDMVAATSATSGLGLTDAYTGNDLARALEAVHPDFVLNLTTPSAHRDVAVQALEAGFPVLCEKPMADSMENARDMVRAAERSGKLLMVSQQRRYDPRLKSMRRLIEDHIGQLGIMNSDFYRAHRQQEFHRPMQSPLLLDMAIHTFDAARYVSGADPLSVWCEDFRVPFSGFTGRDSALAVFEMTGGLRYTYRGSWSSAGVETSWEAEWRAVGPHGTAKWDGVNAPWGEIVKDRAAYPVVTSRVESAVETHPPVGLAAPLADFLDSLDTGAIPMGECSDNIKSLAMVLGAIESAATGERCAIDPR